MSFMTIPSGVTGLILLKFYHVGLAELTEEKTETLTILVVLDVFKCENVSNERFLQLPEVVIFQCCNSIGTKI